MWVEYHRELDIATIYLRDYLAGENEYSYICEGEPLTGRMVLDFDHDRRLVSVEIANASQQLAPEVLATARVVGKGRRD